MKRGLLVLGVLVVIALGIVSWNVHRLYRAPGWVDFGATPAQCLAAFHLYTHTTHEPAFASPRTRAYVTGGWMILVGFDEEDRAEQFIYARSRRMPFFSQTAPLSKEEQAELLEHFKGDSAWIRYREQSFGSSWQRGDEEAFAVYYFDHHDMVLMNWDCFNRHFKKIPGNNGKELAPPKGRHPATQAEDDDGS